MTQLAFEKIVGLSRPSAADCDAFAVAIMYQAVKRSRAVAGVTWLLSDTWLATTLRRPPCMA